MKLPWDKQYIKIAFHVAITVAIIYALKLCIDFVAYTVTNVDEIFNYIGNFVGWLLSVCVTLVIAFVIAYVFDPVVDFFQNKYEKYILKKIKKDDRLKEIVIKSRNKKRQGKKENNSVIKYKQRTAGTILTFLVIIGVIVLSLIFFVNKISASASSSGNFVEGIVNFVNDSFNDFTNIYNNLENVLKEYGVYSYAEQYINSFVNEFTGFVSNIGNGIVGFIYSICTGFLNVIIGFVIAFYFMRDKESIKHKIKEITKAFLPEKFNIRVNNFFGDINAVFSGYIRGQVIDASIMSVLISTGLLIIDVDFAIVIGVVSGFANIIPYFGAFIAFILAIAVTLLSGTPIKALYAAIIILVLQQLDGIVIGPKVVGENVKLSPVLVIIALTVAAELFGLWGMILAVPIFAIIKLFAERFYHRQKLRKEALLQDSENV